jgi:hypothetical protein
VTKEEFRSRCRRRLRQPRRSRGDRCRPSGNTRHGCSRRHHRPQCSYSEDQPIHEGLGVGSGLRLNCSVSTMSWRTVREANLSREPMLSQRFPK